MDSLIVSEIFGPTVQGEGPTAGQRCAFVRLGRCNLDCAWCDTPYTWDWHGKNGTAYDPAAELSRVPIEDIVGQVEKMGVLLVVVSGGEPLLQATGLATFVEAVVEYGDAVEIETNGTRPPLTTHAHAWLRYNVSPKLPSSGVDEQVAWVPSAIEALKRRDSIFKFVIKTRDDENAARRFVDRFGIEAHRVWLMPEGRTTGNLEITTPRVAAAAVENGWNFTSRLQVLAWGPERGH